MKTKMLIALQAYALGQIELHKMNVEVYLENPVGIGEHSDVLEAIQSQLGKIAEWEDQLFVLEKHFEVK